MILGILDPIVGKIILLPTALQWELWKDVDASFVFPPIVYGFSAYFLGVYYPSGTHTWFYIYIKVIIEKKLLNGPIYECWLRNLIQNLL